MLGKDSADRKALAFQEVVDALGLVSEVPLGVQVIPVDRIVGSVDKVRDFDPKFRPNSGDSRRRWERIAEAARRGEPLPPIDVYQVGEMYFVRDGHHRGRCTGRWNCPRSRPTCGWCRPSSSRTTCTPTSDLSARSCAGC